PFEGIGKVALRCFVSKITSQTIPFPYLCLKQKPNKLQIVC
ncbi:MAG: hypothetical protein ACI9UV_003333, partial [Algoriphagus sp.]